jgi:methionyl-tRNA formyltransferase
MLRIARCAIDARDTAGDLHDKLAELGPPALLQTLEDLALGRAQPQAQDDALSCYAAKIDKAEAAIDWQLDAATLDRRIRAFNPFPIAYATLQGERIKIYRAQPGPAVAAAPGTLVRADQSGLLVACGAGSLNILELQLPGGKVLSSAEVLNGRADWFAPGRRFDHA